MTAKQWVWRMFRQYWNYYPGNARRWFKDYGEGWVAKIQEDARNGAKRAKLNWRGSYGCAIYADSDVQGFIDWELSGSAEDGWQTVGTGRIPEARHNVVKLKSPSFEYGSDAMRWAEEAEARLLDAQMEGQP